MLYFLRGRIQVATGAYADARESFVKARDLDPVPFRPCSEINSLIRRAASGFAGVYLVDMERAFEEHSNNGLVGFDFMADNCHRTPLGESVAAQAIIEKMLEIGFLPPAQKPQKGCCPVNVFLADAGYLEPKSPLRFQALFHNGIYVMRTPFLYYEASHRYLLEAKEVNENSWQVWANLATLSYFKGDNATGAKELQRATELHGKPINADDLEAAPYLKEALEVRRRTWKQLRRSLLSLFHREESTSRFPYRGAWASNSRSWRQTYRRDEMVLAKARKVGLVAIANLAVALALLTLIELACRHLERAWMERAMPAELKRIPPKGPSEIRVFAFGGSTVFGLPAPPVAFVAQTRYWLRRLYPNRNIRILNFGYPGEDTAYVLRQLTRWLDDQPDLVIVATGHNEFFGPHHGRMDRLRFTLRLHFATMRLLDHFVEAMMNYRQGYIMPCQVDVWDPESAAYKGRIANFNEELNQIVKHAPERRPADLVHPADEPLRLAPRL